MPAGADTIITFQMTFFDPAHFERFMRRALGEGFIEARLKEREVQGDGSKAHPEKRLWKTRILESATLLHHEMLVEVPFNPIEYQSMEVRMRVPKDVRVSI